MKALRAGQVALNSDLSGMPRLRFLRQVGAVARILYMSDDFLTLNGIQAKAFDYRLGNRSALEWVIDQYRVKTDKRSGIVNDPNRADDPEYIVKLIGKVVAVSLEAVGIVEGPPNLGVPTH